MISRGRFKAVRALLGVSAFPMPLLTTLPAALRAVAVLPVVEVPADLALARDLRLIK